MRVALLLCLLPLALATEQEPSQILLNQMQNVVDYLVDQIQYLDLPNEAVDTPEHDPKLNALYSTLQKVLQGILSSSSNIAIDQIPKNGTEDSPLFVRNATILGIDQTVLQIYDPSKFGFDIENLTVYIPSLDISAEKYKLNNVDLGILVLNGDGNLHIKLTGIKLYMRMTIKRLNKVFSVKTIPAFEIDMTDSLLELENLGGSGESMSHLLNGIASKVLAKLIRSLNLTLVGMIEEAGGDCENGIDLVCDVISYAINQLMKKAGLG